MPKSDNRVIENLTEEEAYLFSILTDPSGLDHAEFLFYDPTDMGKDDCFRAWPFQWCFTGDTKVITKMGHKPIKDLVGTATLLTESQGRMGKWVKAEVEHFGRQKIVELDVERYGVTKTIRTTAEHRWFAGVGRRETRTYPELQTLELEPGMFLRSVHPRRNHLRVAPYGVVHGMVWGDGTLSKRGGSEITLWGEKLELAHFLPGPGAEQNRPEVSVPGRRWYFLPRSFKRPVDITEAPSYLFGWLAGYFATDGSVSPDGTCTISSAMESSIELVRDVCVRLGISVGLTAKHDVINKPNSQFSTSPYTYVVTIRSSDLEDAFFLRPSHFKKWKTAREKARKYDDRDWRVKEVRYTDDIEDVYCAVVPETHSFVLDGYILTGNCWWRNQDPKQIDQGSRSLGKSKSIQIRACAFPFVHPGEEMVITAPELIHLEPITTLIESQFYAVRLLQEMLPRGRSAVTHRPFQMNFLNKARIIGRIPQRDGRGVKGLHPIWLEMDEAQDYPALGWKELVETVKVGVDNAVWRAHGVTRGVQDEFFRFTTPSPTNDWSIHHYPAMWRPTWSDDERERKIRQYSHSRDDPDYRRNVLGLHGDATQPIFNSAQLMKSVDIDVASGYNINEYFKLRISKEELEQRDVDIDFLLDFPRGHLTYAGNNESERRNSPKAVYWVGMDIGLTIDPSEILVFVEYPKGKTTEIKLLTRVSMVRMPHEQQVRAILSVLSFYRPKAFCMDKGGLGYPFFQEIQEHLANVKAENWDKVPPWIREHDLDFAVRTIKGYTFSDKIVVGIDETIEVGPREDVFEKAGIRRNAKEHSTDVLREIVDKSQFQLPWDETFLKEFQGATQSAVRSMDQYGKRRFSSGNDHCIGAGTLVTTERGDVPIESVVVGDRVLTRLGWRRVQRSWMAAASAEVLEVELSNGASVVATPEHRFHTDHGWVEAGDLLHGDILTSLHQDQRSLSSKETPSTTIPVRALNVKRVDSRAVYDLTVEGAPEFFANGVLVHNCLDASRFFALGWSQHAIDEFQATSKKREPVFDSFL